MITYVIVENGMVYLISVYDKAEYDSADANILLKILKEEGL